MKKMALLFGLFFAFSSVTDADNDTIVIAKTIDDVVTIVQNPATLKTDWENFINSQSDIPCTLNTIEIVALEGNQYLVVKGTRQGRALKASIRLIPNSETEPTCWLTTGFTVSCETVDCSSESMGCVPMNTSCSPCTGGGKCKKTVSNSPSVIFPTHEVLDCE